MAADEKKIIFSGQDNVSSKVNQIYQGLLGNAKKQTESLREQNTLIEKQIRLLEQKNKVEQKEGNKVLQEQTLLYKAASTPSERSKYEGRVGRVKEELETSSKVVDALKELVNLQKRETSTAERSEKELVKENQRKAKYEDLRLARAEAKSDPKGIRRKFAKAEAEGYGDMSSQEIERLHYQKSVVDKKGEESNFKSTLKALLVNDLIQGLGKTILNATTATTGEQGFNSLLAGIPFIGNALSSGSTRAFEEQSAVGIGLNKLKAMSGNMDIDKAGNTELGFSSKETIGLQTGLMSAAGRSSGLSSNVSQAQNLQKGLGLSQETLVQIVRDARTIRSAADMTQIVSQVIKANPELVKDQTKLAEVLQMQSSLVNQLATQTENVNQGKVSSIIGALRSVGGSFGDPTLGMKNISSINQSLTNPSNDFQKARSFGILSGLKPGASFFELLEMQEKGISQKGLLGGTLKQLQRETGGGENFALSTMTNLGLGASTSRKLTEAFAKNPKMFDSFTGPVTDTSIEEILSGGRAKELTSKRDVQAAQISDAFLDSAATGMAEALKQVFQTTVDKLVGSSTEMSSASKNLNSAADSLKKISPANTVYSK